MLSDWLNNQAPLYHSLTELTKNNHFQLGGVPAGNHGSCIHLIGLDICFNEYNCHDTLQARLVGWNFSV